MKKKPIRDLVASVHQRLLDKARQTSRPFNELLQYFAIERFLYRLSQSKYSKSFVLKGALMLNVWQESSLPRPTLDIDLLGKGVSNQVDSVVRVVREVCGFPVSSDGVAFDPNSVQGTRIAEDAGYEGVRVRFSGSLGKARLNMQLDVGFGDVVVPSEQVIQYPSILDFPNPRLRGYSKESTVAEKFEAAVRFGDLNSRMKDFFDIWFLSRHFDFDGPTLRTAIMETFSRRSTELSPEVAPLTSAFAEDTEKATQWSAFRRRSHLETTPESFEALMNAVVGFLEPVAVSVSAGRPFKSHWSAPGPWFY